MRHANCEIVEIGHLELTVVSLVGRGILDAPIAGRAVSSVLLQKFAMIATSGDDCASNCDLFDEAVRRMATFAKLPYIGYLADKDTGDNNLLTEAVLSDIKTFADKCTAG